ncbi:hypothetical protein BGZ83_001354 [Gryganskiella cystojenkinii]|nr:hypothetical protein BGZ83_001354 [Gryganskiella cystojenkinii]
MVKIALSLLSIAAVVAAVSASSCVQETFENFDYNLGDNKCIYDSAIKEYQTFQVKSVNLNSIVSKERDDDIVVGGITGGDKMFQELELCVVSSEAECNPAYQTHCIYENVEYRFRVNSPIKGYLRVVDNEVLIVPDFLQASGLNLQKISAGAALRIGHKDRDGRTMVFSATRAGRPIVVEEAIPNKVSQWLELKKTSSRKGRFNLW